MTEGLGLQFWPLTKLTTEQTVQLIQTHLPQWCGIFRLLQGEGSDDYNFYSDPETLLKGLEVAKAFDAKVIVPLNSYWELMHNKYGTYKDKAEIARKSNLAIVNECVKSGVKVYAYAICNEIFAKLELIDWKGSWTYNTTANIAAMNAAARAYMDLAREYESILYARYFGRTMPKVALPMGTDLNLGRKTWDSCLYFHTEGYDQYIFDAHLYPSQSLTGQPLKDLFQKRIGRAAGLGKEIIIGELACNFGMYGTEKVNPWATSKAHFARLQEYFDILSKYPTVTAGCLHRAGSYGQNSYNLIQL